MTKTYEIPEYAQTFGCFAGWAFDKEEVEEAIRGSILLKILKLYLETPADSIYCADSDGFIFAIANLDITEARTLADLIKVFENLKDKIFVRIEA